jgi:hypothetical protein
MPDVVSGRGASRALALVLSSFGGAMFAAQVDAQAPEGIACDPDVRVRNPACTAGNGVRPLCRRFGGSCGPFGILNWACLDDPSSNRATAPSTAGCDLICSGSTGVCEDRVILCNVDLECRNEEQCLDGVCTFVGAQPPPPPPPGCTRDGQCGSGEICLSGGCVLGECRGDWECRTDERCINHRCGARCPEGQTWVPNPIGNPPIPLGRCQSNDELIQCCYRSRPPFPICRVGTEVCPVDHVCSPLGVCYSICGHGPCPGELPRLPDRIPSPDQWPDLARPPIPGPQPRPGDDGRRRLQ